MRVLVFHGYLLRGTGSNVYNAELAAALVRLGHEVHLLSQDRGADALPFVDAVGDWHGGMLAVRTLRQDVRCTVYRPPLAGVLPVYVADRYEGIEARPFPELTDDELAAYVDANVRAVRDVVTRAQPDVALANHAVMGPLVLARALDDVPYAVKIHGSAIEYVVRPHPDRFLGAAREGLARARGVLVGSRHTAERLWDTVGDPALPARTRLGPPGVDVERFTPRDPTAAREGLAALAQRLDARAERRPAAGGGSDLATTGGATAAAGGATPSDGRPSAATAPTRPASAFAVDDAAAARAVATLAASPEDRLVAFVGKLIVSKGIDLLVAAWPLVLASEPRARLVVVGFGAYRAAVEALVGALDDGDLKAVARIAAEGAAAEGRTARSLEHLKAFLDGLSTEERRCYVAAARGLRERIVLTGRLEHAELAELLPACEAQVVPSTFPEAFGMVAAEAAACGALPVCADHSGLAEVVGALAAAVPEPAREWLAFPVDGEAVRAIAARLVAWLQAPEPLRAETRQALVATARERWSWEGVARGVIAAAQGDLDVLPAPDGPALEPRGDRG